MVSKVAGWMTASRRLGTWRGQRRQLITAAGTSQQYASCVLLVNERRTETKMRKSERYENLNPETKIENALKRMTESWHT